MNSQTIVMCVVSLILGMLLANMLKSVCGCKLVEGQSCNAEDPSKTSRFACEVVDDNGTCLGASESLSPNGQIRLTNMNCGDTCKLVNDQYDCNNINEVRGGVSTGCNCEWSNRS